MNRILAAVIVVAASAAGGLAGGGQSLLAPGIPGVSRAVAGETAEARAPKGLRTISLGVRKMDCAACAYILRRALEDVDGVASAKVSYGDETAVVTYDPARCDVAQLVAATARVGFPSSVRE